MKCFLKLSFFAFVCLYDGRSDPEVQPNYASGIQLRTLLAQQTLISLINCQKLIHTSFLLTHFGWAIRLFEHCFEGSSVT